MQVVGIQLGFVWLGIVQLRERLRGEEEAQPALEQAVWRPEFGQSSMYPILQERGSERWLLPRARLA